MSIMQGQDVNFWFWIECLLAVGSIAGTWYFSVVGRDRKPRTQRRGEDTIEDYGNGLREDRAPLPKFLIYTIAGVVIWSIGYLFWTGFEGLGY